MCGRVTGYGERSADGWRRYNCPAPCNRIGRDPYIDGVSIIRYDSIIGQYKVIWSSLIHYLDPKPGLLGNNHDNQLSSPDYWFCTTIPDDPINRNTYSSIKVGVCRDQSRANEDILLEHIELYVR